MVFSNDSARLSRRSAGTALTLSLILIALLAGCGGGGAGYDRGKNEGTGARAVVVEGVVADASGAPLAEAAVILSSGEEARTDAEGRFTTSVAALAPEISFTVISSAGRATTQLVSLAAYERETITVLSALIYISAVPEQSRIEQLVLERRDGSQLEVEVAPQDKEEGDRTDPVVTPGTKEPTKAPEQKREPRPTPAATPDSTPTAAPPTPPVMTLPTPVPTTAPLTLALTLTLSQSPGGLSGEGTAEDVLPTALPAHIVAVIRYETEAGSAQLKLAGQSSADNTVFTGSIAIPVGTIKVDLIDRTTEAVISTFAVEAPAGSSSTSLSAAGVVDLISGDAVVSLQ